MNQNNFTIRPTDDVEKIEEEIIEAADKAGRKNVIVNIFSFPAKRLKRRWHVRYKFNKKHLVMDILIAVGILVLIGLNIFWAYGGFHYFINNLNVVVSSAKTECQSGESAAFTVNYANNNSYKIEEAVLSVRWPKNFQVEKVSALNFNLSDNTVDLGSLKAGANGGFTASGRVIGDLNEEQILMVNINYYKTGKTGVRLIGQFENNSSFKYKITGSYLSVQNDLPERLANQEKWPWTIKIKNTSADITYEKIVVVPNVDNELVADKNEYTIENLAPGKEASVIINGKLITEKTSKSLGFKVYWQKGDWKLLQADFQKETPVLQPNFQLSHSFGKTGSINPGEWVDLTMDYNNAGDYTLENAELSLNLTGEYWDLSQVKKETGRVVGNKIVWNFSDLPRLALIQPREKGQIKLSVKTKEFVANSQALNLASSTSAKYKIGGQAVEMIGDEINSRLNSNLSASVYPMYFALTGDQLGRGPLPPRVGKETKYWIFVKLINDISAVKNVSVKIGLPANVVATGLTSVPVGDPIQFDNNKREFVWQISEVPVKPANIGFAFEAGIIPTLLQAGTYPALIDSIIVSGYDSATGDKIEKSFGGVTTNLNHDPKGKLKDGAAR
ncbi:MAG: hypothetical protein V1928_03875 [Parcubacteria group bacterium]